MGEIHIFCPIPLNGYKSKCGRLGKKPQNGILELEKLGIGSKEGGEKIYIERLDCALLAPQPAIVLVMNSCMKQV
jgi:hypothetical protein